MNELWRVLDSIAQPWMASLLRASIDGGVALGAAWVLCRTAARLPAAWKCWLLRLAYLKLLISLLAITPVDLPLLRADPSPGPPPMLTQLPIEPAAPHAFFLIPPVRSQLRIDVALMGLWAVGSLVAIIAVVRRWRAACRVRAGGRPVVDAALLGTCERLARVLGLRYLPFLLESDCAASPLLVGLLRPAIVLPACMVGAGPTARMMLAHELAHVQRRDLPWGLLAVAGRIVFWFHPVLWLAEREWWLARESACDHLAMSAASASAAEYGRTLLAVATSPPNPAFGFAAAGVIESKSTLHRRLSAMKNFPAASRRRWTWIGAGLSLAATFALVPVRLTAQPATNSTDEPKDLGATASAPPADTDWKHVFTANGMVEARTWLARPAIDGVIATSRCNIGQHVKRGDVLFQLDDRVARAQLVEAEAQYNEARADTARLQQLAKAKSVSDQEVEQASMRQAVAAAEIEVRKAALDQTRIAAPIDGVVSKCSANPGDVVSRGAVLAGVVQLDPLTVSILVSHSDYERLQVGQEARVLDRSGAKIASGKVSFIAPEIDPASGTGEVRIAVANPTGKLYPGMPAQVQIPAASNANEQKK